MLAKTKANSLQVNLHILIFRIRCQLQYSFLFLHEYDFSHYEIDYLSVKLIK